MQEQVLLWTKISAIGQLVGAAATFAAVAVSLWVVLSERRESLRLVVGKRLIVGGGHDRIAVVSFEVTNIGVAPIRVNSAGWRSGWVSRGPAWARYRHAVQMNDDLGLGVMAPFDLLPGRSASLLLRLALFLEEREANMELFGDRAVPLIGERRPPIHGLVYTARGTIKRVEVEGSLAAALNKPRA